MHHTNFVPLNEMFGFAAHKAQRNRTKVGVHVFRLMINLRESERERERERDGWREGGRE